MRVTTLWKQLHVHFVIPSRQSQFNEKNIFNNTFYQSEE